VLILDIKLHYYVAGVANILNTYIHQTNVLSLETISEVFINLLDTTSSAGSLKFYALK